MKSLQPYDLSSLSKPYKFAGGRLVRVRQRYAKKQFDVELIVRVVPSIRKLDDVPKPVRLRIQLASVEEMRFQKRPNTPSNGRIPDAHFGYFGNLFYVSLDSWSLTPGERPAVFDFRSADVFFGCREVRWEELTPKSNGDATK
jgi:hypothetical protein